MNPIDTLPAENLKTDILIVGGGGAGLAAAVAAAEKGANKHYSTRGTACHWRQCCVSRWDICCRESSSKTPWT